MSDESALNRSLTGKEVVTLFGAALFKLHAADAARDALHHALKQAGLQDLAPAVEAVEAQSRESNGKKKGPDSKAEGKAEKDKKPKKPRAMSDMNLFMALLSDTMHKDPNNPAYQLPTTTDENGKVIKRGIGMQFISGCWKALDETSKQRYESIVGPFLSEINEAIAKNEGKPANLGETLKEWLVSRKHDKEIHKILSTCVEKVTGKNPGKAFAPETSIQATPSKVTNTSSKPVANGTVDKRSRPEEDEGTANKKVKSEDDKSDKKKKKKEKKEKELKAKLEAERKKKEEEEARKKKAAAAAKEDSDSDTEEEEEEEDSDDE